MSGFFYQGNGRIVADKVGAIGLSPYSKEVAILKPLFIAAVFLPYVVIVIVHLLGSGLMDQVGLRRRKGTVG
jgi:hypothetical protein